MLFKQHEVNYRLIFFGIINCILYSIISYQQTLYGEMLLNICYYLPLQFIGFAIWKKNMNTNPEINSDDIVGGGV